MDIKAQYEQFCREYPLRTAVLNDCTFRYHYYQNPDPKNDVTILTLAGGTGCGEGMFYMFNYFKEKYSMVFFNYPMTAVNNEQTAKAIADLIRELKLKKVYLLGQSYGGFLAQIIAKNHPDVVKGLILAGTASMSTDGMTFKGIQCIARMLDDKKIKKNLRTDKMLPMKLLMPLMGVMVKKAVPDPEMRSTFLDIFSVCSDSMTNDYFYHMDVLLADLRNYFGTHHKEDFAYLDGEVLIFFSKEDTIFTEDLKETLKRVMTNPTVIDNLEGGHLALMKDVDRFIRELDAFIAKNNENYR